MSLQRIRSLAIFLLGGSFFIFDQILKKLAANNIDFTWYIWKPWIGWEYFENTGVAFGIPIPWYMAFVYTPILIIGLFLYFRGQKNTLLSFFGGVLIFFGAMSNLFDRISYHFTIDYIRIFTSILNLADIMIVVGALILFWKKSYQKQAKK